MKKMISPNKDSLQWRLFKKIHPAYQRLEDAGIVFNNAGHIDGDDVVSLELQNSKLTTWAFSDLVLTLPVVEFLDNVFSIPIEELPLYLNPDQTCGEDFVEEAIAHLVKYRLSKETQ